MTKKSTWYERINKAKEELYRKPVEKHKVLEIINQCLVEKHIDGIAIMEVPEVIKYKTIMDLYQTNREGHIIWIAFSSSGHVAVVGAGTDINTSLSKKNRGTGLVLSKLEAIEWDRKEVIIVPIRGLERTSNGLKKVKNILQCRNGVEHCIGEFLIKKGVPILNYYSHKNYSDRYWKVCEERNYCL